RRIKPLDGEAFFNSAIIAMLDLFADSNVFRKPRGMCNAACRSNFRKSTFELDSRTLCRVAATMSAKFAILNLLIIWEKGLASAPFGVEPSPTETPHARFWYATDTYASLQGPTISLCCRLFCFSP